VAQVDPSPPLDILCCPACRSSLTRPEPGILQCTGCAASYPIREGIPRFVPAVNYAGSFGFQWNRFRRTQLDSFSGVSISHARFVRQTGWTAEDMRGALVLDVGCGAGRFTEVALSLGAQVVAVDYSSAVDACRRNHENESRLSVVQADMYRLPFKEGTFDRIYCFGVIQHTPDPHAAVAALASLLRPGGHLAIDVYPRLWTDALWPKYWLRPVTTRLPSAVLFEGVQRAVRWLWPVSLAAGRVPLIGRKLRHMIPIVNYEGVYPLSPQQLKEWAVLDTFDMLSPTYDQPQRAATIRAWLTEAGLEDIQVFRSGFLVGRGRKPSATADGAAAGFR
jgi:SAM-dependent methyltransferase